MRSFDEKYDIRMRMLKRSEHAKKINYRLVSENHLLVVNILRIKLESNNKETPPYSPKQSTDLEKFKSRQFQ